MSLCSCWWYKHFAFRLIEFLFPLWPVLIDIRALSFLKNLANWHNMPAYPQYFAHFTAPPKYPSIPPLAPPSGCLLPLGRVAYPSRPFTRFSHTAPASSFMCSTEPPGWLIS